MKISSWNVNSVRARIQNIVNYLKSSDPDILMIQEIKTEEINFPFDDFKNLGYESYVFGQKSYNGVAFLSKININKINLQFIKDKNNQSRIISGNIKVPFLSLITPLSLTFFHLSSLAHKTGTFITSLASLIVGFITFLT